jgi:hypothetical protein
MRCFRELPVVALVCFSEVVSAILVGDPLHVLFSVGATRQRAIVCRMAHVRVHSGIIRRIVIVRPAGLISTACLPDRACS